jgi:hypothetical protein
MGVLTSKDKSSSGKPARHKGFHQTQCVSPESKPKQALNPENRYLIFQTLGILSATAITWETRHKNELPQQQK